MPSRSVSRSPSGSASPSSARPAWSRKAVLESAVAFADERGIDALSMRRLAERLGVVPMALYKHVADKEDLLDGLVEVLLSGLPRPVAARRNQWRPAVTESIAAVHQLNRSHPWLRQVLETRTLRTPAVLDHMEHLTSLFLAAGFSPDLTHHVMHLLGSRIWGFSPELFNETPSPRTGESGRRTPRKSTAAAPDPTNYPGILTVSAEARARHPEATTCDEDFEFDFALEVLLDAAERLRRSKWSSPD